MNKRLLVIGIALLMVAAAAGTVVLFLFPYPADQMPKADNTGWSQEGMQMVADANNRFAFDLYSKLGKTEKGNLFYSPYSISAALAMTYEGARGQTADEIRSVFHYPESSLLRPNFAAIYNEINKGNKDYELKTGNALWVQKDFPFLEDYKSSVEKFYGGKAAELDFARETEQSRQTINSFIEEQTNDRIKDLIPSGALDPMTRLVITNAIYFKGTWKWEFDSKDTREQDFKVTQDEVVRAQMMYMKPDKARFNYADTGELQILELPYRGDEVSMLVLLPAGDLDAAEASLSAEKLKELKNRMQETHLDAIYLPKFEFDTKYLLTDTLSSLGMPSAFSSMADFSGMTKADKLSISQVIHQAFVKVDEKGTEAAAATAVVIGITSARPNTIFRADHPFVFIIQQKDTGNILFIGRVTDPTK